MATKSKNEVGELTYENILKFVRTHDDPCVTAGEIAETFEITNEAANWRLQRLEEKNRMQSKMVGASAKVWYLVG